MLSKTLDSDLIAVIRQITDRYITTQQGTPVHAVKTQLGNKRHLLEEAVRDKYLLDIGPKYFPRFRALEFEDHDSRRSLEHCATVVLKALRAIYERDGDRMCDHGLVLAMCNTIDPDTSPACVSVGMLFATDFSQYVHMWNASQGNADLGLNLPTSDRLLDFTDLTAAWKQELENRKMTAAPSRSHGNQTSVRPQQRTFETVGETYVSEGVEGEGSTARVFRVRDSAGNRWALKCMKPEQATVTRTKRFLNELKFCLGPCHPNVVQVVDEGFAVEEGRKCPFFVMRLYPSTLRRLQDHGLPSEKRLRYFSDILNGVEAAHLKGVWHRDLKPENILHDPTEDKLLVSDFGIAHFTSEQLFTIVETTPTERLANFQYAAPEQRRRGASVDLRADIYALGLILNEIFTTHVLQGEGYVQIGAVAPAFGYLDDLVARMVQQSPENRPLSIEQVKRLLIARQNEFVSLQKLDSLKRTVVPLSTVDDPLVQNPIQVKGVDVRGNTLVAILNQVPTPHWLRVFLHPREMSFIPGTEPANWSFDGKEAQVTISHVEGYAQQVLNHFKDYVGSANAAYREYVENAARQQEENERRALQQQIAEEENRQRILSQLKI